MRAIPEPLTAGNRAALFKLAAMSREVAGGMLAGEIDEYDGAAMICERRDRDLPNAPPLEVHPFIYAWSEWDDRPEDEDLWVRMTRSAARGLLDFPLEEGPSGPMPRVILEAGHRCSTTSLAGDSVEVGVQLVGNQVLLQAQVLGSEVARVLVTAAEAWTLADMLVNTQNDESVLEVKEPSGHAASVQIRDAGGARFLALTTNGLQSPEVPLTYHDVFNLGCFLQRSVLVPGL